MSEVENLRLQVGIIQECTQANIIFSDKLTPFLTATSSVHISVPTQGHIRPESELSQNDPVLTVPAADLDNRPSDNTSINDDDILKLVRIQNHPGLRKINKHKLSLSDGSHHPGDCRPTPKTLYIVIIGSLPTPRKPDQLT